MRVLWERLRFELAKQSDRAFVWLVVAFAAGIALFFAWRTDPSWWTTLAIIAVGAGSLLLRRRFSALGFTALAVIAFGLGHGAAEWRTARMATPLLERESRPFILTATVGSAERNPGGNRLVLSNFVLPDTAPRDTPRRLRITIPAAHGLPAVDERILVRVVVRPAAKPVLPDGFQFQRFLYFQGIGGVGYSLGRWEPAQADAQSLLRHSAPAAKLCVGGSASVSAR